MILIFCIIWLTCLLNFALCGNSRHDLAVEDFIIVNYNLENLFDTIDSPSTSDEEYTPEGSKNWTQAKMEQKLNNMARVLNEIAKIKTIGAMVLCEVENSEILNQLIVKLDHHEVYKIIHEEGDDHRGIEVAIVYNKNILVEDESDFIEINIPDTYYSGRDMVISKFNTAAGNLTIIGNHLPSHYGDYEQDTEFKRLYYGEQLRLQVDAILQDDPFMPIVITGDFNDNPMDPVMIESIGAACIEQEVEREYADLPLLINLMCYFDPAFPGTLNYRGDWYTYDQFVVTKNLIGENGLYCYKKEPIIFAPEWILEEDGDAPLRTFNSREEVVGYSDHLPVLIHFGFAIQN